MKQPSGPAGLSPTIAYVPGTPPEQRPQLIAGITVVLAAIVVALHVFGGRPYGIGIPVFVVLEALLVMMVVRGGLSVGRDWIATERFIGRSWVHSTALRTIDVEHSRTGAKVVLEDGHRRCVYVDLEQLRRSRTIWKTVHAALRQSVEHGAEIGDLARGTLEL